MEPPPSTITEWGWPWIKWLSNLYTWAETRGEFTATLTIGSGSVTLLAAFDELAWRKSGSVVHVQGTLGIDTPSTPVGAVTLGILPFAALSSTDAVDTVVFPIKITAETGTLTAADRWLDGAIVSGGTTVDLTDDGVADLGNHLAANTLLYFSFTYFTDD